MHKLQYEVVTGCTLCGMCLVECKAGAILLTPKGAKIDPNKCLGCGTCYRTCASEAIQPVQNS